MKYLVTGGTGFIGSSFIKNNRGSKNNFIILSRNSVVDNSDDRIINNLNTISDNEKIDCIINLAGQPIDIRWTNKNKKELIESRVKTSESLVSLVTRLKVKPKVILSASAIGFYGNKEGVLDEKSSGQTSFTHILCKQWENAILNAEKYGVRVSILRLGVVLGQSKGFLKKILLPFTMGLGGRFGDGAQPFSWIHIEDVVLVMNFIIRNKKCAGIYNLVAPEIINNAQMTSILGKVLKKSTLFHIPRFLINMVFGEMGCELILKGSNVIPKRLVEQGYCFKYNNFEAALRNILKYNS